MKSRGRREAKGKPGILVRVEIRVLGVKMKKERGDRDWADERSAREEGDDIEAENGIVRSTHQTTAQLFFLFLFLCFGRKLK